MLKFEWSEEGKKNAGLSDEERAALEKTVGTTLDQSIADGEKIWTTQQAAVGQLYQKYRPRFDDNLQTELKKIDVSPKAFDADMSDWMKATDPQLREQLGQKITALYLPALLQAFGTLGNDLMLLQKELEAAVGASPTGRFQWIGPIGFAVFE